MSNEANVDLQQPICILGASVKNERPSHLCVLRWAAAGHPVWPVHPSGLAIGPHETFRSLAELPGTPQLISLYLNPGIGITMVDEMAATGARYVWLNPGTESAEVRAALEERGLQVIEACNLVALSQGNPLANIERWLTGA